MKTSQIIFIVIFCIWMLVRCIPLLLFPGLYGFDAWYHLGVVLGILENNRIPLANPYNYPYYHHAGLHVFAVLINQLTGLSVITCLQLMTIVIAILTFLAFYALFRSLLKTEWLALLALLLLAIVPDFLVQTNTTIPEAFALIYLPLAFLLVLKLVRGSPSVLSLSTCLGFIVIFLHFTHHWTTLLFITGCLAMLIGVLLIRPQNLKTGILATTLPAFLGFGLLLFDPFTANLFRIYLPISLLIGGFILVSIIILSFKGHTILGQIQMISKKIQMKYFFISGFLLTITILLIIIGFYPIARPIPWQLLRFIPLAIFAGLTLVSLYYVLNIQRPKVSLTSLVCWLVLLSLMFISGFLLTLSEPTSWYQLTTLATITHRLLNYIVIASAPLAAIGMVLIISASKHKSQSRTNNWRKGIVIAMIGLIGCSSVLGVWNIYYPAGGWHQTWYTQTEIQAAYWFSEVRNQPSITYLDARLRWLFYGVSPTLPSNHSYVILDPTSDFTQIDVSGDFYVYFFVSEILEQQFMRDFSTPPLQIQIRPLLDTDPRFTRLFSSTGVDIYYLNST